MNYDTLVITAQRQSNVSYLDRLLETYGPDSLTFVAGSMSENNQYLDKYRTNERYNFVEQDLIFAPPHINMNLNYCRAYLHRQNCTEFLTVEDDIFFTKNWGQKLRSIQEQISHPTYILSLYWSGIIEATQDYIEVPQEVFSCTQGILYVNMPITELMTYIFKYGVDKHTDAIDLLIGRFCRERDIPICVTNPSLVQHVGLVGNNISPRFHMSASFRT